MLKHIYIKNFTIISQLDLELHPGLTVLTGETGAGKSIVVDALSLVLGERFDVNLIRHETERCEISACFDVTSIPKAQDWLHAQALDEGEECIISRIITRDGRSKNTINGRPCALQQLRELGEYLVHIHSQNQQYALLKQDYQRELLDAFAQHSDLCAQVQSFYLQWQEAVKALETAQSSFHDKHSQIELWQFQSSELDKLNLKPGEIAELGSEHKQLSNAEQLISSCQSAYALLEENEQMSVLKQLNAAQQQINHLLDVDSQFQNVAELIRLAIVHTQESADELRHYLENFNLDPERLQWIDRRLSNIQDLARKHRIKPEQLYELQENLRNKLKDLECSDQHLEKLQQDITQCSEAYQKCAAKLSTQRTAAAKNLGKIVNQSIAQLGMPNGQFQIELLRLPHFSAFGNERIEFLISTNPGQPLQPLNKAASGGELSRIALAIQVATAQTTTVPSLIFDEVDVGIGGGTAEIVGRLLKTLSKSAQILCITHLPQVAAQGHQHLQVAKQVDKGSTSTAISLLSQDEKIHEIARMLGGVKITQTTLEHARELLSLVDGKPIMVP
jgi:DNA repair protein RecN (Recombination protein N)